jgi:hypothetical protein
MMLSTCAHCDRLVDADILEPVTLIEPTGSRISLRALMGVSIEDAAVDDEFLVSCDMWCPDCVMTMAEESEE